jgi:hypothetical protein
MRMQSHRERFGFQSDCIHARYMAVQVTVVAAGEGDVNKVTSDVYTGTNSDRAQLMNFDRRVR